MTLTQIEAMTEEERYEFLNVKCHSYDPDMSLPEYTEAIRDYIYIWRRIDEGRRAYTWDSVCERVASDGPCIKACYDEHESVDDAAIDVDYSCG